MLPLVCICVRVYKCLHMNMGTTHRYRRGGYNVRVKVINYTLKKSWKPVLWIWGYIFFVLHWSMVIEREH